ncbi:MAG TPA: DUF1840 domain-containing protein [Rhodocyclaceae bacterium]|nr:DUF1840 domain-containing protein [Rhodocyclaceae bacterium]
MLISFKSSGASDVMMFGEVAAHMLEIMGKDPAAKRGVITVEQLPAAIEKLRAATTADKAQPAAMDDENESRGAAVKVSLTQRAIPLIELLNRASRESEPVIWEG